MFQGRFQERFQERPQGFSLLELMLVCALMALLLGFGGVQFTQWHWRSQFSAEIQQVLASFELAKTQAQKHNRDYWLGIQAQCLWLAPTEHSNCNESAAYKRPQSLNWQAEFASGNQVKFTAGRGMSGFSSGRLRIQHRQFAGHEVRLIMSALGRIRLCETQPLLNGVPPC